MTSTWATAIPLSPLLAHLHFVANPSDNAAQASTLKKLNFEFLDISFKNNGTEDAWNFEEMNQGGFYTFFPDI